MVPLLKKIKNKKLIILLIFVVQVDSLEKLDPEVEEILVDIAEDFVDSVSS